MADARDRRLLAIAHGGANSLKLLQRAQDVGADYVEADVRLHRSRLEVRHFKTMRWLPLLYDRHPWRIAPGWTKRLIFSEVLPALSPATGLMIDLKGDDGELPAAIIEAIRATATDRPLIVCGQNWPLVDPFVGEDGVRAVHSIGRASQLSAFLRGDRKTEGVSIHMRLLTTDVVEALHERAPFVITWPINSHESLRHVADCGVDGVTTDSLAVLRAVVAGAPYGADAAVAATAPPGSGPTRSR